MTIRIRSALLAAIIFLSFACLTEKSRPPRRGEKFHPGHYVAVGPGPTGELAEIKFLDDPALRGVNKRYSWRTLEPEQGQYDFSVIGADLEYLKGRGKRLVVFLNDKSFSLRSHLPPYLRRYEFPDGEGGFTPVRWHPFYIERLLKLARALGERCDAHPNLEGVAVQESALEITPEGYAAFGYTPEKYRDALIAILTGLAEALPSSRVFWYSNFLPGDSRHLHRIADAIAAHDVCLGGPDLLPHNWALNEVSYPMYEKYRNRLILFCSAQGDSYRHHKNDFQVSKQEPLHPEGYMTMEEIFLFARDSLHVRYLFWDYEYATDAPGQHTFDDAAAVIRAYPSFNESLGPIAGGR